MKDFKYVILGVGTNLGDKLKNIETVLELIEKDIGEITAESKLYKTSPWGFTAKEDFFNAVIKIRTILDPIALLKQLKLIEQCMGRNLEQKLGYQSRIIDLDILDYNGQMFFNKKLVIPHPLLIDRNFVILPLNDIDPNWKHPVTKVTISQLIEELGPAKIEIVRNDLRTS